MSEQSKNSWTALVGALTGALLSGASLAFFFGGEMRQIAMNRQSIIELRNMRNEESGATLDALHTQKIDIMVKQIEEIQRQLVNGRNSLIQDNIRIGVLETKVDDLRKEILENRKRLP